jgi:hypothetical protein
MKLAILVLAAMPLTAQQFCLPSSQSGSCFPLSVPSPHDDTRQQSGSVGPSTPPPPPVKCGKYEHADPTQWACGQPCAFDSTSCVASWSCAWTTPKCVDDVHVVTEKEWQALLPTCKGQGCANAKEEWQALLPTCKGQGCADAEYSCKPGFIYDKDYKLCAHHFVDHAGNNCWTGQDDSGAGCSVGTPPGTKLLPDGSLVDAGGITAEPPPTYKDSGVAPSMILTHNEPPTASTVILATSGSKERIEMPTVGNVILVAYDNDGRRTLTVYRDGRVLAEGADPDEITKYFWKLFADTERTAVPACINK